MQYRHIFDTLGMVLFTSLCFSIAHSQTDAAHQEQSAYFFGEAKITSPAGQTFGSTLSLAKRTLKPAESRIIEQLIFLDPRRPAEEHITIFDIKGSVFTVKDEGGRFTGEGELGGKAWQWTEWKSSVKFTDGRGTLKSEDKIIDKAIVANKWLYRPDGKLSAVISEELKPISKEAYEILRTKLLQK